MRHHAPRATRRLATLGITLLSASGALAGCRGDDAGTADTGATKTGSTGQSTSVAAAPSGPLGGTLPEPLDSLAKYPRRFVTLVRTHSWVGWTRPRECDDTAVCSPTWPTTAYATVTTQAIEDAHLVDLNSLPQYGIVVSRMFNTGNRKERRYGIPGNTTAEWYFVVEPGSTKNDTAVVRIAVLSYSGVNPRVVIYGIPRTIVACPDHGDPPPTSSTSDFRNCPLGGPQTTGGPDDEWFTAPDWLTCSHGCCKLDMAVAFTDQDIARLIPPD